jgi:hypothetical protein
MKNQIKNVTFVGFALCLFAFSASFAKGQLDPGLFPISHNRYEVGNTQAVKGARYVGKIVSVWPNGVVTEGSGVLISRNHVLNKLVPSSLAASFPPKCANIECLSPGFNPKRNDPGR